MQKFTPLGTKFESNVTLYFDNTQYYRIFKIMLNRKYILFFIILTFSLISIGQSDTLNQTDTSGQKQGYWIIYGVDKPEKGYCDTCIVEEGTYINNRKNGSWIMYQKDSMTPRLIGTFVNGRPIGEFLKIRNYPHDNVYESGSPKSTLKFNKMGKQHGINIFYYDCDSLHPNLGQIEVKYKMDNGQKIDTLFRYYRNGDVKERVIYNSEHVVKSKTKYARVNPAVEIPYTEVIDSNNYCKRYYEDDLIFEGECIDGKIWNGKKYIYDSDGILIKIELWKEGKYYADGQF